MEADMIRYLIKNNLKIMFRSPVNIIMYVLCPIIVSAVIMSAFSAVLESHEGPEEFTVGYTIDTESQLNAYIDTLKNIGQDNGITFKEYDGDIEEGINKNDLVKEIGLNFAWHKDSIQLTAAESYSTILPEDFDASDIQRTYRIPESIDAPVKAGDKVGTFSLSYKDQELTTIDLIASENVDKSELLIAVAGVKKVVTSQWFILAVAVILAVFVIYLIVVTVYSRKRKRRRPVKKYRKF